MSTKPKEAREHQPKWPEPVQCEYHEDLTEEDLAEIRKLAGAPKEDDPNWVVVDGPAW